MYPQILYWKWNDDLLDDGVLEKRANDIINRSCFSYIYVAPHSMVSPDASLTNSKMKKKISDFAEIMHKNGRKAIFDVDIRAEPLVFFNHSRETAQYSYMASAKLDESGRATVELISPALFNVVNPGARCNQSQKIFDLLGRSSILDGVLGAWCIDGLENGRFDDKNVTSADQYITIRTENDVFYADIDATKANAGRVIVFYPRYLSTNPDTMCDKYLECQKMLLEEVKDLPLDGLCLDEWGVRVQFYKRTGKFLYTAPSIVRLYKEYCGRDLYKDLLYFFCVPKDDAGKSIKYVNDYITVIRRRELEGEQMLYDSAKQYFGQDAFVGCHPTWWGSEYNLAIEALRNGVNWWETPRDYAQTDEKILHSIRGGMARTKSKPVWYNMWYSMRTMDINTYFEETWVNARFGGRTHHLGYECYEPGVVYTFWQEGRLEQISQMEEQISKLNSFQKTKPDARVLMLFGMEAFTNWNVLNPGVNCIGNNMKGNSDTLRMSGELLADNYLHDLVPTTEIDRGLLTLCENKACYGGHTYDAVVVVNPNGCSKKAAEFIEMYSKVNSNLVVIGKLNHYADGSRFNGRISADNSFDTVLTGKEIGNILRDFGVKENMTEKLCVFEDGSVIATTDGKLNVGNPLTIEFEVEGHKVSFEGKDFIAVRIENGNPEIVCGEADKLEIDGKSIL